MEPLMGAKKFFDTATGTTTASVTEGTPTSPKRIFITDIAVSSDKGGAYLTIKQGGSSTPFSLQFGTSTPFAWAHSFEVPIIISVDNNAVITIDGSAFCRVNVGGYVA